MIFPVMYFSKEKDPKYLQSEDLQSAKQAEIHETIIQQDQNIQPVEQNKKNLKNNNQLQIDIQIIEEDQKNNNSQNKFGNQRKVNNEAKTNEKNTLSDNIDNTNKNSNPDFNKNNDNINMDDYQAKTPVNPIKSIDRQSTGSKNNSVKREKSHSFNYEAQSERSFNQMRRNKFHSPKDQRQSLKKALSVQSDETKSIEAVSPKEELNQLYALLQQDQMQQKKDKITKNTNSKGSIKGSARNISKELQQESQNEYFESSQENPNQNNNDKLNNNSTSSIFDRDSFKEFTEKKLKQIMNEENINEILKLREQALEMRHKSQMNAMNQMLSDNHVSPRTYDNKKIELDTWVKNEKEEITQTRKALERGLLKAYESIKKTQRDMQLAQRFKNNPIKFDSRSSFASEEEYLIRRKYEQEGASNRSDSETHSDNLSSSQGLKYLLKEVGTPTTRNNIKIIDKFEVKDKGEADNEGSQEKKNKKSLISKKYNQRYADGDYDEYENEHVEDEEGAINEVSQQPHEESQASPKQKMNLKKVKSKNEKDEASPKIKSPQSNSKKDRISGQGVKLILEYNDFDSASANKDGEQQNFRIPTLSSSSESINFQQQNLDRLINEKMVTVKRDEFSGKGSKKSPRFEENAFPFSPLSDISKDPYQFHQQAAAEDNQNQQHENSDLGASPNKKSPRDTTVSLKQSNSEDDEIEQLKYDEEKEYQERNIAYQQLASPSEEFIERNEMLAEMQDRWKTYHQIDTRIQEQLQKLFSADKSDNYGIPTNLKVITDYVEKLFEYVVERYQEEFLDNLNTPFGFAPSKRLKLIHGYDSFADSSTSDAGSSADDYNTLPFILSEDLFIEFEQNIIGNGDSEQEQIIKEFEHIHNKAIFDTFNETLNIFRPYFTLGGPPYSWTKSEKNLILGKASTKNLNFILEKSKTRVIEWASYLCGLVNEEEVQPSIPLEDENGNPPPLSVLLENLTPQNEYLAQVREERLSKMLLTEIFENEYKWQLYEDEKAEVVMELADMVFEELVEEVLNDISDR